MDCLLLFQEKEEKRESCFSVSEVSLPKSGIIVRQREARAGVERTRAD